jgi:hypothetical protein
VVRIEVVCAAERADAEPLRFILGERTIEVDDLLDRWYGADADYVRVLGGDGHLYVLKHLRADRQWELASFTRRGSHGTGIDAVAPQVLH